jgi:hypothetical protein
VNSGFFAHHDPAHEGRPDARRRYAPE